MKAIAGPTLCVSLESTHNCRGQIKLDSLSNEASFTARKRFIKK